MIRERPQRLVTVEADAVEVVRLALGPLRGRRDVDDARNPPAGRGRRLEPNAPSGCRSTVRTTSWPPSLLAYRVAKRAPPASASAIRSR